MLYGTEVETAWPLAELEDKSAHGSENVNTKVKIFEVILIYIV